MSKELDYIIEKYKPDMTSKRMPYSLPLKRLELVHLFSELDYKIGAEIGVREGYYSEEICKANPGAKLYSVDGWKTYKGYRDFTSQSKADRYYREAIERLAPYNCELIKKFSMDAVQDFKPNSLDFVYIDANHDFKNAACDIVEWSKVVRPGGIVAGHDFKRSKSKRYVCNVKDVVQAYAYAHEIRPWFALHGDRDLNWMWVKE